jgi:hypothetical protein
MTELDDDPHKRDPAAVRARVDEIAAGIRAQHERVGKRFGAGHRYQVNQEEGPKQGHAERIDRGKATKPIDPEEPF